MRALLLLLCLLAGEAWGADWYVRPIEGTYGAANGTSYSAAFDGMNDIVWDGAGVVAGDTLYVCGSFDGDSKDGSSNFMQVDVSGSAGNLVTINGDCSAHETNPSSWSVNGVTYSGAKLDGQDQALHGIRTMANSYITIKNLELTGFTDRSITMYTSSTLEEETDKYITVTQIYAHDNTDTVGTSDSMIDGRGNYISVTNNLIVNAPGDGIFNNGPYFTATGNDVRNVGTGSSVEGDCIIISEHANGSVVSDNTCDHTAANEKQCYIINAENTGDAPDDGAFTFARNTCEGFDSAATAGACAYLGSGGAWQAYGNRMTGCDYSYQIAEMGAGARFYGNIGIGADDIGLFVGSAVTAALIYNNIIAGSGGPSFQSNTAGTGIVFYNNAGINGVTCFDIEDANNVQNYNACYGHTNNVLINSGSAGTLGANSVTTDPKFVGGTSPTTAAGFKLRADSPLRRTGLDLNLGNIQDNGNRAFLHPPSIGAWEATSRDEAAARTAR